VREEKPRAFNSLAEAMAKIQEREARHADPGRLSDEVRERIEKAVELVRAGAMMATAPEVGRI